MTQAKKKILVVDDELAILRILKVKLRVCGYDVVTALDGRQALDIVRSECPDLIVLDIIMPNKDGFEVLRELRQSSRLPVIVFSARPENAQQAYSLGANVFLSKPFDVDELVRRIASLLDGG